MILQRHIGELSDRRDTRIVDLNVITTKAIDCPWANRRTTRGHVNLHREVQRILCAAVCDWSGVALTPPQLDRRTALFASMIDGAGGVGPRNWVGQWRRNRTERWAADLIRHVRSGEIDIADGAPLRVIARHRDANGELLSVNVATVEWLNLLRPVVAVTHNIVYATLRDRRLWGPETLDNATVIAPKDCFFGCRR